MTQTPQTVIRRQPVALGFYFTSGLKESTNCSPLFRLAIASHVRSSFVSNYFTFWFVVRELCFFFTLVRLDGNIYVRIEKLLNICRIPSPVEALCRKVMFQSLRFLGNQISKTISREKKMKKYLIYLSSETTSRIFFHAFNTFEGYYNYNNYYLIIYITIFISLITRMRYKRDIKMGRLCTPGGAVIGIVGGGVTFRFF